MRRGFYAAFASIVFLVTHIALNKHGYVGSYMKFFNVIHWNMKSANEIFCCNGRDHLISGSQVRFVCQAA